MISCAIASQWKELLRLTIVICVNNTKILYRSAVEEVPDADYEIPLGKAEVMRTGNDVTIVGWGSQLRTLQTACDLAAKDGISCELIDLLTILPWDSQCIINSVKKTGKLIVSMRHQSLVALELRWW